MLDKQSRTPMHAQIEENLKRQINDGEFPVETAIPSDRDLTERLGVSRIPALS